MADCFTLLVGGDLLSALVCPFTNILGAWFYALGLLAVIIMIYFKSNHNLTLVSMIGLLAGTAMSSLLPSESITVAYIIIALSMVGILYKIARK